MLSFIPREVSPTSSSYPSIMLSLFLTSFCVAGILLDPKIPREGGDGAIVGTCPSLRIARRRNVVSYCVDSNGGETVLLLVSLFLLEAVVSSSDTAATRTGRPFRRRFHPFFVFRGFLVVVVDVCGASCCSPTAVKIEAASAGRPPCGEYAS